MIVYLIVSSTRSSSVYLVDCPTQLNYIWTFSCQIQKRNWPVVVWDRIQWHPQRSAAPHPLSVFPPAKNTHWREVKKNANALFENHKPSIHGILKGGGALPKKEISDIVGPPEPQVPNDYIVTSYKWLYHPPSSKRFNHKRLYNFKPQSIVSLLFPPLLVLSAI